MSGPVPFDAIVRGLPIGKPPSHATPEPPPQHSVLAVHWTARPGGGPLTHALLRLVGGADRPTWALLGRGVKASEGRRFFGRDFPAAILSLEEGLEEGFWVPCYKLPLRAMFVHWWAPSFLSSSAWTVDARGEAFRFTLFTYVDKHGEVKPDGYRSRVRVSPSSGGRAAIGFDRRKDPDPQDFVTGPDGKAEQYRGRFCSLSTVAYQLTGDDQLRLLSALRLWGIAPPTDDGPTGMLQELDALESLCLGMQRDLERWPS